MRSFMVQAFVLAVAQLAAAEEPKERTISTSGESVVFVQPDEVILNFGVETRDQNLDKAETLNDEAANKVVAAVKKIGIEDKHIQTAQLNLQILYHDSQELTIRGYSASRSYSVTLKDPKKFQALIDAVIKNGANRINNFEYRTKELRKYRDQARAMAIKAAREKAEALARELKCSLGNPRTIAEGGGWSGYWGSAQNSFSNSMGQNSAQSGAAGEGDEEGQLPLGQIAVRANVSVTFDLIVPKEEPKS